MQFINRTEELAILNEKWLLKTANFFVIYGKRRVGKTELIKHFIKDKSSIYFLCDKRSVKEQLKELGRLFGEKFNDAILSRNGFSEWIEVFEYLKNHVTENFVFAIDEYPYLVETDSAISSIFQKGWDEYLKNCPVFLIICGSSMSVMESEALLYKSPLYGRRTGQILIKPLTFHQSKNFFPEKSFANFLDFYATTGGMPAYLLQFNANLNLLENIEKSVFPPSSYLHNEIEFILKEELREPKNYLSILKAVSLGKRKLSEIINDTGLERNSLTKYMSTLANLQLLEKENPVTEDNPEKSRKGLYKISDNFFRFWFQYVFPFKSDLEIGRFKEVVRKLEESFQLVVSLAYENVCREMVWHWQDSIFSFERVGSWWEKNNQIDLVALNKQNKEILFGECKWSNKPVGINVYTNLKQTSALVDWNLSGRKAYYILFSKSGFTPEMIAVAKKENVFLVQQDKIIIPKF